MKRAALIVLLGALAAPLACSDPPGEPAGASVASRAPTPVLVELFTSEGCSSCPPADRLLTELQAAQPITGARIVALGEHVDYWDNLGWPDRFSSAAFTERQSEFQRRVFGSGTVYTPQIVVDGVLEAIGSDPSAVRRAIRKAADAPKAKLEVTASPPSAKRVIPVTVRVDLAALAAHEASDVLLAVVEDGLSTAVARGENRGRTLSHSAVVRSLDVVGSLAAGRRSLQIDTRVPLGTDWNLHNVRLVAFVQERASRRIRGVGTTAIFDAGGPVTSAEN